MPTPFLQPSVRRELGATVRLAGPIIATQLGEIAIHATDVVMIGRLGAVPLAAGTLGAHYAIFFLLIGLGIATAVQPLVAQARGARDVRGMRRYLRQGLWASALVSLPIMLIYFGGGSALRWLGQTPETAGPAGAYLQAMLWGVPGALGFMALRGFVAAHGRPNLALWVMLAAICANAGLNYLLIYGSFGLPRLELVGAGIASSIVNLASCAALAGLVLSDRRLRRYRVFGRFWRPDWPRLRRVFEVGTPIGMTMIAEAGVFVAATVMMGWLGSIPLAAHGIAIQIVSVMFMIPLGIGLAATVRVGLAHGAGDWAGVGRAGGVAYAVGGAAMLASTILLLTLPETLIGLFLTSATPGNLAVAEVARDLLLVAALFQLADGAQAIGVNALRGLSDTRMPMLYAVIGYWGVGLAAAWGLGFAAGLGSTGIWFGLALGLAVVAVLMAVRFHRRVYAPGGLSTASAPS